MAKNNALLDHEVALLPVQGRILFSASSEDQTEIVKAFQERISKDGEIIHEHLEESFYHTRKYTKHTTLECCRCITKSKGHEFVCKCSEWTCEYDFLLILRGDRSIHQENNNTHVWLNVPTSGQ